MPTCHNLIRSLKKSIVFLTLLVRRIWRSANVQVAQIAQRGFIFFAHAAREVWIIQVLVAGAFRHIFQYRQTILNGAFAVRRHLLPPGEHVILDVVALCGRHFLPYLRAFLHFLALRRI